MALLGAFLSFALLSSVNLSGTMSSAATAGTCPASAPSGITQCFYADYVNGSDTNAGTSESAPLQHFPGMTGCSKNCSAITPTAGEGFILRGGITWPAAALPWVWTWTGTSTTSTPGCTGSGCIYIGVDPTWYSGSAWARPILNGGGASGIPNNDLLAIVEPGNYIILDNVEFTGFYWSGSPGYGTANIGLPGGDTNIGMGIQIEHVYIHGWSHSTASGTTDDPCGITGDTGDVNNNTGTIVEYSVISGADTTRDGCNGALFGSPPFIAYNVMEYVASCMVIDGTVTVHDNICQNVVSSWAGAHENALEINFDGNNVTIYNNVIRHLGGGALGIWCGIDVGFTCYMTNNVIYDTDTTNVLDFGYSLENSPRAGTDIFWNNTVECGQDSNPNAVCAANIGSGVTAVTLQNNHFITNAGSYWSTNGPTPTLANNLLQTKSVANGQGYTSSEVYAFSPTAAYPTNSTPGQGSSATSLCSASGTTVCSSDTTYGVSYDSTNHTVTSPGRPNSTWKTPPDIGAYSYGSASGPPPPTGAQGTATPQ